MKVFSLDLPRCYKGRQLAISCHPSRHRGGSRNGWLEEIVESLPPGFVLGCGWFELILQRKHRLFKRERMFSQTTSFWRIGRGIINAKLCAFGREKQSCPNALILFSQCDIPGFVQDEYLALFGHGAHKVNLAFSNG